MMMTPRVTAIVPTLAEASRKASLLRAIESLQRSVADPAILRIRVIVNGQRFDPETVACLRSLPVLVTQIGEGSLPIAQAAGRQLVDTQYFCFLDDDDEYLPSAIDQRLAVLDRRPELSMVVTNGWVMEEEGRDTQLYDHLSEVEQDPQRALFRGNWFASCGSLIRADPIACTYFDDPHDFLEWIWLAFRITNDGHRVGVLDVPTFRIHQTLGSRSKSSAYTAAHRSLYERMLRASSRADIRRLLHARLQNQWSMYSMTSLHNGNLSEAWKAYGQVLRYGGALRYGSQLLRLVLGSASQLAGLTREATARK